VNLQTVARTAFIALVAIAAIAFSQHILIHNAPHGDLGIDFAVFQRAAHDPADLVYRSHKAPFAYPPTALVLMRPMTSFGYWFWVAASALLFVVSVALLAGKRVAALSLASPGLVKGLVQGQSAMLLGGLLFVGLRLSPLVGGSMWGVAAAIKPQMLLFAPVALIARREWTMLAGMALGFSLMVLASLLFFDPSLWSWWPQALSNFNDLIDQGALKRVISPAGWAAVRGFPTAPFVIAGLVLGVAVVAFAAPTVRDAHLVALITASSIVASPYAQPYDTTALIPACVMLLLNARWIYAIPAGLIFIGIPQMTVASLVFILVIVLVKFASRRDRDDGHYCTQSSTA